MPGQLLNEDTMSHKGGAKVPAITELSLGLQKACKLCCCSLHGNPCRLLTLKE